MGLRHIAFMLLGVLGIGCAEGSEVSLADEYRDLAVEIPFLNLSDGLFDRAPGSGGLWEDLLSEAERAAVLRFWELAHAAPAAGIERALSDADPKVRAMAILAAHWSEGRPTWLPKVAGMANNDDGEVFPSIEKESPAGPEAVTRKEGAPR